MTNPRSLAFHEIKNKIKKRGWRENEIRPPLRVPKLKSSEFIFLPSLGLFI